MKFWKYATAGNDFVLVRGDEVRSISPSLISSVCRRRTGIGADGLLVYLPDERYAFRMRYFNADGSEAAFCGDGALALVTFAVVREGQPPKGEFNAGDGVHRYAWEAGPLITLTPTAPPEPFTWGELSGWKVQVGVPHYVVQSPRDPGTRLAEWGPAANADQTSFPEGVNLDLFWMEEERLYVRTYERGVNAETLACGTGAVAVSSVLHTLRPRRAQWQLHFPGGVLNTRWADEVFWLGGTSIFVFAGETELANFANP